MLTDEQRSDFFERGFTRLPGALPIESADRMLARLWHALEERHGMRVDDSTTWTAGGVRGIGDINREPEFRPFGSQAIEAALDDLLGAGNWARPASWGQILATFPADEWDWNSLFQWQVEVPTIMWHTDYPYTTPPDELAGVQVFCLLADIETGGGGTLVVEGSHRVVQQYVCTAPTEKLQKMKRARVALLQSHPWFKEISRAVSQPRPEPWMAECRAVVGDVPVAVNELTGSARDVYLTHPWLLHAPSPNCNSSPRLMCTQRIQRSAV